MLTVLMECRDQEAELAQTLSILVTAAVEGLVSDVIILDHASSDGSSRVADAAGCRFHSQWDLKDILSSARGQWLFFIEAGARPQSGWIEEVMEHVAVGKQPARFSPARNYRRPFLKRIAGTARPIEYGLLLPKPNAVAVAKSGMSLEALAKGLKPSKLNSEMIPAWVAAAR
jgi:hypothetical protein